MNELGNSSATKTAGSLSDRVRSLRLPDSYESQGSAFWWLPWALCLVLLGATGFLALEAFSPIDDDTLKKLAEERKLTVTSESAQTKLTLPGSTGSGAAPSEIALESKGYIVPISLIQVSPKISGTVLKLNVDEGMEVPKDFVLAVLEDIEYKSDLDHTVGARQSAVGRLEELRKYRDDEVRQAKADLEDTVALRDQASAKFKRTRDLKQRGAVSPEDYESAESAYKSYESRVQRLQLTLDLLRKGPRDEKIATAAADVAQAQADFDKADWRWNNTKVKAPIKGIILSKKTEEGNIVNPSAFSNGLSASLCEMADLWELEVDLSIAERDISKTFKGQDCRIRAEAFPNRIYMGYVSRIMPMGDRSKGAVPVRVKFRFPAQTDKGEALPKDKQGEYLRPEMGAIVTFLNRKREMNQP
jgi:multidrug resistance efflux pump